MSCYVWYFLNPACWEIGTLTRLKIVTVYFDSSHLLLSISEYSSNKTFSSQHNQPSFVSQHQLHISEWERNITVSLSLQKIMYVVYLQILWIELARNSSYWFLKESSEPLSLYLIKLKHLITHLPCFLIWRWGRYLGSLYSFWLENFGHLVKTNSFTF